MTFGVIEAMRFMVGRLTGLSAFVIRCALALVLAVSCSAGRAAPPVVAVDVGHTLADGGAISARGVDEFIFNRQLAGLLADTLQRRAMVVREINFDGAVAGLADRPHLAKGSEFFISIHHDSIGEAYLKPWEWRGQMLDYTDVKRGFGLFVSRENPDLATSLRCASSLGQRLRRAGFEPSTWHARKHAPADIENGVWYYDNLLVLRRTTLPALLLEAGVIKHRDEELALADPERQALMAEALADGLADCLAVRETPVPE